MFKLNIIKIFVIINYILKINSFQFIRVIPKKTTNKYNNNDNYNDNIPLPPTAEAIFNLKNKGFTYEESLKALVIEKNNETAALIYLNKTKNL